VKRAAVDEQGAPTPQRPLCLVGPEKLQIGEALPATIGTIPLVHSIPHTTRAPRDGEVEGQDYYFISMEVMTDGLQNKMFIEAGKYKVQACTSRYQLPT
jgi:guanylate kinase